MLVTRRAGLLKKKLGKPFRDSGFKELRYAGVKTWVFRPPDKNKFRGGKAKGNLGYTENGGKLILVKLSKDLKHHIPEMIFYWQSSKL